MLSVATLILSALCHFDNKNTITEQYDELLKCGRSDKLVTGYMSLVSSCRDNHISVFFCCWCSKSAIRCRTLRNMLFDKKIGWIKLLSWQI